MNVWFFVNVRAGRYHIDGPMRCIACDATEGQSVERTAATDLQSCHGCCTVMEFELEWADGPVCISLCLLWISSESYSEEFSGGAKSVLVLLPSYFGAGVDFQNLMCANMLRFVFIYLFLQ